MAADTPGAGIEKPVYEDLQDSRFPADLNVKPWVSAFGGWALQTKCPSCGHENGIDAFVPSVIALFRAGPQEVTKELVACVCDKNHGAPAGKSGCGRWGYITPNVGG